MGGDGARPAFRILGPLEVLRDGHRVEPSSAKLRTLLIDLLVHRTQLRTSQQLVDDLWADRPPVTAAGVVRNYLSQLRELLGPEVLVRRGAGGGDLPVAGGGAARAGGAGRARRGVGHRRGGRGARQRAVRAARGPGADRRPPT